MQVSVILTSMVAFLVQGYFMWRIWVLTKNFILTGTILALAMLSLAFGLGKQLLPLPYYTIH
jgi:hypothetical protein